MIIYNNKKPKILNQVNICESFSLKVSEMDISYFIAFSQGLSKDRSYVFSLKGLFWVFIIKAFTLCSYLPINFAFYWISAVYWLRLPNCSSISSYFCKTAWKICSPSSEFDLFSQRPFIYSHSRLRS